MPPFSNKLCWTPHQTTIFPLIIKTQVNLFTNYNICGWKKVILDHLQFCVQLFKHVYCGCFQGIFAVWVCAYTSLGVALYSSITFDFSRWDLGLQAVTTLLTGHYALHQIELADPHGARIYVVSFQILVLGSLTAYVSSLPLSLSLSLYIHIYIFFSQHGRCRQNALEKSINNTLGPN